MMLATQCTRRDDERTQGLCSLLTANADSRAVRPSGAAESSRAAARVAAFLVVDAVTHVTGVEGEGAAHVSWRKAGGCY